MMGLRLSAACWRSSLAARRQRVGESPVDVAERFEIEWLGAFVEPLGWFEVQGVTVCGSHRPSGTAVVLLGPFVLSVFDWA